MSPNTGVVLVIIQATIVLFGSDLRHCTGRCSVTYPVITDRPSHFPHFPQGWESGWAVIGSLTVPPLYQLDAAHIYCSHKYDGKYVETIVRLTYRYFILTIGIDRIVENQIKFIFTEKRIHSDKHLTDASFTLECGPFSSSFQKWDFTYECGQFCRVVSRCGFSH